MQQIKRKSKLVNQKLQCKNIQSKILETPDINGMYPIHIAVKNNDLGTLEDLIHKAVNLDRYNRDRDTALLLAIKENNPQIVEKLLEEGADFNKCDINLFSPLNIATNFAYQECIDLLTEYSTAHNKIITNGTKNLTDNSYDFVDELVKLLRDEISPTLSTSAAETLTQYILRLLKKHLNLKKILQKTIAKLHKDINQKVIQFMHVSKGTIKISTKDILKLARKIIIIIQDHKNNIAVSSAWNLNRIESLIEEKIVSDNVDAAHLPTHVFVSSNTSRKTVSTVNKMQENWYSQNGYRNFDEFVRINSSGAGPIKFLKFSSVSKENILQNTRYHGTETLETATIKPAQITTKEALSLLISDALKRIKEEQKLFHDNLDEEYKMLNQLLLKAEKKEEPSLDDNLRFDKILRPGKKNKIHLVHFQHSNEYELFWHDLTKEAFLTGATIHLFNVLSKSHEKIDLIYSGIAIVNNLLDQDIHPDKIILQSYGHGYLISKAVKSQFQKRGVDLTQINYQHPLFIPIIYPESICNHRKLHLCSNIVQHKKMLAENSSCEFSKFTKHIAAVLERIQYDTKSTNLTDALSKNYSLTQLINIFITASQYFLKEYLHHRNPTLPQERVEKILGIVNV